jgi:hypothetical protein
VIVIPMAGLSRRFTEAGYTVPKYMLQAYGQSVFAHAVRSFSAYFDALPFLFIVRDVAGTPDFVRSECRALGIAELRVAVLEHETRGQAETVANGLDIAGASAEEPVTIFNIDTVRPSFAFSAFVGPTDGYLEVFRGSGANWSYVRPLRPGSDIAAETAEKRPISDLCCTGLYHFASAELFRAGYVEYLRQYEAAPETLRELYVAPMYNLLIKRGCTIRYAVIGNDKVIFCGVPSEYDAFKQDAGGLPWVTRAPEG